ncbi:MAG: hypothetical protein FWE15_04725 [Actinomycetia bacterium]|nr:hypothetical protein [Actinomycetes bacterium]
MERHDHDEAAGRRADPSFTCPQCKRTSRHPSDVAQGYCGACHRRTGMVRLRVFIESALAAETWAGTGEQISDAFDRHSELTRNAHDAGRPWLVEIYYPAPPAGYFRFGTDAAGMDGPEPLAADDSELLGILGGYSAEDAVPRCPGCGDEAGAVIDGQAVCAASGCAVTTWSPPVVPPLGDLLAGMRALQDGGPR